LTDQFVVLGVVEPAEITSGVTLTPAPA